MSLKVEKYALTTQTYGVPLICTMKKYTRASACPDKTPNKPGVILLLGHGAGFPKETWEPTISDLYELDKHKSTGPVIREIWGLDCQNHGEAATLNEDVLVRHEGILTIYDYANAFAALYNSGLLGTLDPKLHQVVLCGHSAGAVGVTLATSFFNPPSEIPFSRIILVDPPIWSRQLGGQDSDVYKLVEAMTPVRKDKWKSFEDASNWLKKRLPWGSWDDRVFEAYTTHGLRSLPSAYYPNDTGVTLTTHRLAENVAFTGKQFAYDALNRLNQICVHVPIHLIFGDNNDMFEREAQDSLLNEQEGRVFASITRLEDVGHLVPQQAPTKLASALLDVLVGAVQNPITSKL